LSFYEGVRIGVAVGGFMHRPHSRGSVNTLLTYLLESCHSCTPDFSRLYELAELAPDITARFVIQLQRDWEACLETFRDGPCQWSANAEDPHFTILHSTHSAMLRTVVLMTQNFMENKMASLLTALIYSTTLPSGHIFYIEFITHYN
jgi:hypothetical protein